jgi:hypothetical protein
MPPASLPSLSETERGELDAYMQLIRSDPPTEALFGALRLILRHDLAPMLTVAVGYVDLAVRQSELLDRLEPLHLAEALEQLAVAQGAQTGHMAQLLKTLEVQAAQLHQIAGDVASLQSAIGPSPTNDERSLNARQVADAQAISDLRRMLARTHVLATWAFVLALLALFMFLVHVLPYAR